MKITIAIATVSIILTTAILSVIAPLPESPNLVLLGETAPEATITIIYNQTEEIFSAEKTGFFKKEIYDLPPVTYVVTIFAKKNGVKSNEQTFVTLVLQDAITTLSNIKLPIAGNSMPEPPLCLKDGDFNRDNIIDLKDFSAFLSRYGSDDCEADFNSDGRVNFIDFSILLFRMAQYVFLRIINLLASVIQGTPIIEGPPPLNTVRNFEGCAAKGFPILESYPRQCQAPGDRIFVEDIGNELEKIDLIRVNYPRPNETVKSPLKIKGEARGFWFFEADFPVKLLDEYGQELAVTYARTSSAWMTEDFIPFSATLEFSKPETDRGVLILEKDNPSGLPENADELHIPVYFY